MILKTQIDKDPEPLDSVWLCINRYLLTHSGQDQSAREVYETICRQWGRVVADGLPETLHRSDDVEFSLFTHSLGSTFFHSRSRPALINARSVQYFLYGVSVSQREWFDILEFTEEDRTLHCLMWGRHA